METPTELVDHLERIARGYRVAGRCEVGGRRSEFVFVSDGVGGSSLERAGRPCVIGDADGELEFRDDGRFLHGRGEAWRNQTESFLVCPLVRMPDLAYLVFLDAGERRTIAGRHARRLTAVYRSATIEVWVDEELPVLLAARIGDGFSAEVTRVDVDGVDLPAEHRQALAAVRRERSEALREEVGGGTESQAPGGW